MSLRYEPHPGKPNYFALTFNLFSIKLKEATLKSTISISKKTFQEKKNWYNNLSPNNKKYINLLDLSCKNSVCNPELENFVKYRNKIKKIV